MYIEDNNYWNNIHGSDRTVRVRFIIDGTTYSESMVTRAEFETSVEGDNGVSIAGCFAKKMTAVIDNISSQNWNNVTIESHIDITLNGTTYDIPMGIYIPDTVEPNEDGRTVTITAYDQVANMVEEIEVQDDGMDTTSLELLRNCFRSRGDVDILGSYIPYETPFVLPPGRYPLRTWVAYIVGCYGKSAYLSRKPSGVGEWFVEVEMKPGDKTGTIYNTPKYMIDRDAVYQGGFKRTKTNLVVDAIQSENDSYGDLSGNVLSITDPLITPGTISSWGNNIVGVDDIYSYEIHYRGNPVYEVGQTIRVRDKDGNYYPVTITKHVIKVQGGMEGYIYSTFPSSSENLTNQTSPTNELIGRKLSDYALKNHTHTKAQITDFPTPTTTDLINVTGVSIANGTSVNTIASANISKGVYIVELSVLMSSVRSSSSGRAGFFFNTSTATNNYHYAIQSITSGGNLRFHVSGVANVTANGTIYIRGFQNSGGAVSSNVYCRVTKIG